VIRPFIRHFEVLAGKWGQENGFRVTSFSGLFSCPHFLASLF
jgi:hypothetical protein